MNNNDNNNINKNLSLMDIENIKDSPENNINIFPKIEDYYSLNKKPWFKK